LKSEIRSKIRSAAYGKAKTQKLPANMAAASLNVTLPNSRQQQAMKKISAASLLVTQMLFSKNRGMLLQFPDTPIRSFLLHMCFPPNSPPLFVVCGEDCLHRIKYIHIFCEKKVISSLLSRLIIV